MTFSIITCTYNPNKLIFDRLIAAIRRLIIPKDLLVEWIIVDNNSEKKVETSFEYSDVKISIKHIVETKPGLTNARIAGANATVGDWLVFFDDDNEPSPSFFIELMAGIEQHPNVNCWGPGQIEVEYIGKVKLWFINHKTYYQQRKEKTNFGQEKYMQPYYPIGTGLCIKKEAMIDYVKKVQTGQYNVSDRTGKSLVSGGDTQIVLNNQVNGGTAGKLEKLALTHMIEARKAKFKYLRKQKFWTAASYHMVLQQVYKDMEKIKPDKLDFSLNDLIVLIKKYYHEIKVKKKDYRSAFLNICGFLGEYYAPHFAFQKESNQLFKFLQKIMIN